MAKASLTDKAVDAAKLPTGKSCLDIFDTLTPGLCLRVTAGKKSWGFVFTPPGSSSRTRMTLGSYPATTLLQARGKALEARSKVEQGTDPRDIEAAPEAPMTMADLCALRLQLEARAPGQSEFRSAAEIERRYNREVIPVVGNVAVKDFTVRHYNKVLDPINARGAFVLANRVHFDLRRLLKFAVRRGEIPFSPIAEFDPPNKEMERDRWLRVPEIVHFWHHSPKALVRSPTVQTILKLLLVTGKRSDQVCGMRRTELDLHNRLWTIPKARVKGTEDEAKDEYVPLSDLAISLLLPVLASHNHDYLFFGDDPEQPYEPRFVSKAVKLALAPTDDLPKGRLGMEPWTPHDLRRTVGTQLLNRENGLGVTKEQKYLVLNHQSELKKTVSDRVYDHNDYLPEKREALDKWGAFLSKIIGGEQMREAA